VASSTPLGKSTTPAEVADAVLLFASPWGRGVTVQELVVDGGLVIKLWIALELQYGENIRRTPQHARLNDINHKLQTHTLPILSRILLSICPRRKSAYHIGYGTCPLNQPLFQQLHISCHHHSTTLFIKQSLLTDEAAASIKCREDVESDSSQLDLGTSSDAPDPSLFFIKRIQIP
jgi:hypothetical protein